MPKFSMKWYLNPMFIPTNSEERAKLWMSMLEYVKSDLKSSGLNDWGICCDDSGGYAFTETDEKNLHSTILNWMPYVSFDIKPDLLLTRLWNLSNVQ